MLVVVVIDRGKDDEWVAQDVERERSAHRRYEEERVTCHLPNSHLDVFGDRNVHGCSSRWVVTGDSGELRRAGKGDIALFQGMNDSPLSSPLSRISATSPSSVSELSAGLNSGVRLALAGWCARTGV